MRKKKISSLAVLLTLMMNFNFAAVQDQKKFLVDEIKIALEKGGADNAIRRFFELKKQYSAEIESGFNPILQAASDKFIEGQRGAATELLEKTKNVFPADIRIYSVLGQFYWYTEQRELCIQNFKKCLEMNPKHKTARQYWDLLFFVPEDFKVPESASTKNLRLRPLRAADVDLDYQAVMSSTDHLHGTFGPDDKWPSKDLTRDEDLRALEKHEKEFKQRVAFTYTVLDHEESQCLGCVYILPAHTEKYDAQVYLWVTAKVYQRGYDKELYNGVKKWLKKDWPFSRVAFPGRDIDWKTWEKIQY